jgi:hypothetical protein
MSFFVGLKRRNVLCTAAAGLALSVLPPVAVAQEADGPREEPIEEITVVGEKSLLNLKHAAYRAEEDFFKLFNELNQNDEFDVYCSEESDTYSRIKRRRCWSPFEREIDEEELRYQWETGGGLPVRNEGLVRAKRKQQAEMLKQIVLENPELQQLYLRYGEANLRFQVEHERRCGGKILCRNPDEEAEKESEQ